MVKLVYSPACGWSVRFINESWNKLQDALKAANVAVAGQPVNVMDGGDDATKAVEYLQQQDKSVGFPTCVLYEKGEPKARLQGHRAVDAVVEWIKAA